jgi:hypothetical protein
MTIGRRARSWGGRSALRCGSDRRRYTPWPVEEVAPAMGRAIDLGMGHHFAQDVGRQLLARQGPSAVHEAAMRRIRTSTCSTRTSWADYFRFSRSLTASLALSRDALASLPPACQTASAATASTPACHPRSSHFGFAVEALAASFRLSRRTSSTSRLNVTRVSDGAVLPGGCELSIRAETLPRSASRRCRGIDIRGEINGALL